MNHIRHALRQLRLNPGFTAVAVVSLSLGIGLNATIFSVGSALLMRKLPVKDPGTLYAISATAKGRGAGNSFSYPDYADYRDQSRSFSGVSAHFPLMPANLGGSDLEPERIWGQLVSANYFQVLGVNPILGRAFLPEEDLGPGGGQPVAVLSHALWKRRYNSDSGIVGRTLILNNVACTIAGIAPENFSGTDPGLIAEIWVPLGLQPKVMPFADGSPFGNRENNWIEILARLKPGVSAGQAQAELDIISKRVEQLRKRAREDRGVRIDPASSLFPEFRRAVIAFIGLLMGVVTLVLLIACANVANLLLARANVRQKEISVRLALGAGRRHLLSQLLAESLVLALLGGLGGILISWWATAALTRFRLPLALPLALDVSLDVRVVLFTLGLSLVTGVVFGLAPALHASRPDLVPALKDETVRIGSSRRFGGRNLLVIAQMALSLVLLVSTGLFLRSLRNANSIDTGFKTDRILLATVDPNLHGYNEERGRHFLRQVRERVSGLPGVRSASLIDYMPLAFGGHSNGVRPDSAAPDSPTHTANIHSVTPGYFDTMGIPILRGRDFGRELPRSGRVALINEVLAKKLFPDQDPLGRRLTTEGKPYEIIGIVRNTKSRTLAEDPASIMYWSLEQCYGQEFQIFGTTLLVKTSGDPLALAPGVRGVIRALDPNMAVSGVMTMDDHMGNSLFLARMGAVAFGVFGAVGLVLAAVGLYGVISFSVSRRTREIGIRMALGARPYQVVRTIIGQGLVLAGAGAAIGIGFSLAVSRLLASLLYGVSTRDPITFVAVPVFLVAVAAAASYVPARRGTSVDPTEALRYQ